MIGRRASLLLVAVIAVALAGGAGAQREDEPPGAEPLPDGSVSIPVSSVAAPHRLVVAKVGFTPNPLRSRTPVTVRITIADDRGFLVRGAAVFVRGIPARRIEGPLPEALTGRDGVAVFELEPTEFLPLRPGARLVVFVRARKEGDPLLGGVSARRLVSLRLGAPRGSCSAAALDPTPKAQPALPSRVAAMRRAIVAAATACDYEELQDLALAGTPSFTYTFGLESTPAEHWRSLEARGEPVLAELVAILDVPFTRERGTYAWPSAFTENPTEKDWEALRPVYSEEQIESFKRFGAYVGYRVGITRRGDWTFFVAGD